MIKRLINKQTLTVLGLNSGTSADALDCAVVRLRKRGNAVSTSYLAGMTYRLNPDIQDAILSIADDPAPSLETVMAMDVHVGNVFGKSARQALTRLSRNNIKPDLICSHGQTIRHLPNQITVGKKQYSATMQIGSAAILAEMTGKPVVSDIRQAAVGVGGEGAPITGGATRLLLGEKTSVCLVNIGGMSNYFYWPKKSKPTEVEVADCGPGNVLSDLLMRQLFDRLYDKNGAVARKGTRSERLLALLLANPFFNGKTVSTGRELFGQQTIEQMLAFGREFKLSNEDLVTTASELTVRSIVRKINRVLKKDPNLTKLYLTGGGRKNIFLMKRLQQLCPTLAVTKVDVLGVDGDYLEAAAYAVMGAAAIWEIPLLEINRQKIISGRLSLPPKE